MQTVRLADGAGLPPGLAVSFSAEEQPREGFALWLVRDQRTGRRSWLLSGSGEDDPVLATVAHTLRSAPTQHLCAFELSGSSGGAGFVTQRWGGERPLGAELSSPATERSALQLLDTVHLLQALPEPVALPGLHMAQLLVLPLTGFVRLADLSTAVRNASSEVLQEGRRAAAALLLALLPGAGEAEQELLAAWENDGAQAYPALRMALQRLHLSALATDF